MSSNTYCRFLESNIKEGLYDQPLTKRQPLNKQKKRAKSCLETFQNLTTRSNICKLLMH